MTPELLLFALLALLMVVILSATVMRRALGFLAAAIWSLFPVYGAALPAGIGLVALAGGLLVVALTVRAQTDNRPGPGRLTVVATVLAVLVLGREWVEVPSGSETAGLQLAASIAAAALVGYVGRMVRWRQGFAVGLLPGGVILAVAEILRVSQGGIVHAQQAALGVNPIVLAQYAAVAALVIVFQVARRSWRWYALPILAVTLGGIVVSGSRGPLLGVAAAIAYTLIRGYGVAQAGARRIVRLFVLISAAAIAFVLLAVARVDVASWLRIDDSDGNASSRLDAWEGAVATIADSPILGAGPGRYFYGGYGVDSGVPSYPHNLWLEAWSEYGIVPVILLVVVVILAWRRAAQLGQMFVIFAVVAYGLSGSFDTSLVFWICLFVSASTRGLDSAGEATSGDPGVLSPASSGRRDRW
jgi:hypothetical protein